MEEKQTLKKTNELNFQVKKNMNINGEKTKK